MKARAAFIIILLSSGIAEAASPSAPHQYPPGTVGYITENCRAAIQKATPAEFAQTDCYNFHNNFIWGTFGPFMMHHHERQGFKAQREECRKAVEDEKARIKKEQFCWKTDGHSIWPTDPDFAYVVSSWGEWLEQNDPATLDKPIFPHFNEVLHNGPYCHYLLDTNGKYVRTHINRKLASASSDDWLQVQKDSERNELIFTMEPTPTADFYNQCMADMEQSANDSAKFGGTKCGRIMAPFLSGLFFTDVVDDSVKPNGACAGEIERFYKYEILTRATCLPKTLNILDLTKKYLSMFDYNPDKNEIKQNKYFHHGFCADKDNR